MTDMAVAKNVQSKDLTVWDCSSLVTNRNQGTERVVVLKYYERERESDSKALVLVLSLYQYHEQLDRCTN